MVRQVALRTKAAGTERNFAESAIDSMVWGGEKSRGRARLNASASALEVYVVEGMSVVKRKSAPLNGERHDVYCLGCHDTVHAEAKGSSTSLNLYSMATKLARSNKTNTKLTAVTDAYFLAPHSDM